MGRGGKRVEMEGKEREGTEGRRKDRLRKEKGRPLS